MGGVWTLRLTRPIQRMVSRSAKKQATKQGGSKHRIAIVDLESVSRTGAGVCPVSGQSGEGVHKGVAPTSGRDDEGPGRDSVSSPGESDTREIVESGLYRCWDNDRELMGSGTSRMVIPSRSQQLHRPQVQPGDGFKLYGCQIMRPLQILGLLDRMGSAGTTVLQILADGSNRTSGSALIPLAVRRRRQFKERDAQVHGAALGRTPGGRQGTTSTSWSRFPDGQKQDRTSDVRGTLSDYAATGRRYARSRGPWSWRRSDSESGHCRVVNSSWCVPATLLQGADVYVFDE